mmetsp:Transcript_12793/g.44803  ORF Transcript_12793/g.44803 Transcript_12793/m.44803 type:complete len:265 (-) Transcript_12793:1523-2317(-)
MLSAATMSDSSGLANDHWFGTSENTRISNSMLRSSWKRVGSVDRCTCKRSTVSSRPALDDERTKNAAKQSTAMAACMLKRGSRLSRPSCNDRTSWMNTPVAGSDAVKNFRWSRNSSCIRWKYDVPSFLNDSMSSIGTLSANPRTVWSALDKQSSPYRSNTPKGTYSPSRHAASRLMLIDTPLYLAGYSASSLSGVNSLMRDPYATRVLDASRNSSTPAGEHESNLIRPARFDTNSRMNLSTDVVTAGTSAHTSSADTKTPMWSG